MPRALLSVHDKTGIVDLATGLADLGWDLVSSGGTARVLGEAGLAVTDVAQITGMGPILGHRVVTLHPLIHGGVLADRDNPEHVAEAREHGIEFFDLVVVNLYPFTTNPGVEMIDIGGPALVRAAAKNHAHGGVVVDVSDDAAVLEMIADGSFDLRARRLLARKAFTVTSAHDAAVAAWLDEDQPDRVGPTTPTFLTLVAERAEVLRYGENPHQTGARYRLVGAESWWDSAMQLNGKEMSYLNVLDTEAAWQMVNRFDAPAAVIVKHANPCGVALGATAHQAYVRANAADPVSAFGGIVAVNREVDGETAAAIVEVFTEVVVAPSFTAEALEILSAKSALRLLEATGPYGSMGIDVRSIDGGLLVQSVDERDDPLDSFTVATTRAPTDAEWSGLLMAWQVVSAIWSNGIVLVNDEVAVGIGGGQPNRVDAARIAIGRAGERARGSVAASDAFFPFPDGVQALVDAGVTAIIQPGGSVRDAESVALADAHGIAMVMTGIRHFRH